MKLLAYLTTAASAVSMASAFVPPQAATATSRSQSLVQLFAAEAEIQFVRGLTEKCVPNVRLTRARDGSSGVATFAFDNPNVFDASTAAAGEITGMFMIDEEGEISTTSVNARFANGKPQAIESTYVMNSPQEWYVKGVVCLFSIDRLGPLYLFAHAVSYQLSLSCRDRFMRFMERYGEANGLGFSKA